MDGFHATNVLLGTSYVLDMLSIMRRVGSVNKRSLHSCCIYSSEDRERIDLLENMPLKV